MELRIPGVPVIPQSEFLAGNGACRNSPHADHHTLVAFTMIDRFMGSRYDDSGKASLSTCGEGTWVLLERDTSRLDEAYVGEVVVAGPITYTFPDLLEGHARYTLNLLARVVWGGGVDSVSDGTVPNTSPNHAVISPSINPKDFELPCLSAHIRLSTVSNPAPLARGALNSNRSSKSLPKIRY